MTSSNPSRNQGQLKKSTNPSPSFRSRGRKGDASKANLGKLNTDCHRSKPVGSGFHWILTSQKLNEWKLKIQWFCQQRLFQLSSSNFSFPGSDAKRDTIRKDWNAKLRFACKMLRNSKQHSPNGGFSWWFTMVESVNTHQQKQVPKDSRGWLTSPFVKLCKIIYEVLAKILHIFLSLVPFRHPYNGEGYQMESTPNHD